jgi:hypothetical protein
VAPEYLPVANRLTLGKRDRRRLKRALRRAKSKFEKAIKNVLGQTVIFNKAGRYPGLDHLDVAYVKSRKLGRLVLAISVPYTRRYRSDRATAQLLERIAERVLKAAIRHLAPRRPAVKGEYH